MPKLSLCDTSVQPVPAQHTRERADPTNCQRGLISKDVFLLPLSGVITNGLGRDQVGKGSPLEKKKIQLNLLFVLSDPNQGETSHQPQTEV